MQMTGDIDVTGSLLVKTSQPLTIAQGQVRVSGSHLLRIETPELTVGRVDTINGKPTEVAGIIASGGQLVIVSPDVLLRAGAQVLATGNNSSIRIDATYLDIVGSLKAGANLDDTGRVVWTGRSARYRPERQRNAHPGGQGYNASGLLADVGGQIQATGTIDINVTGGTTAVGFVVVNASGNIQSDATGGGAFTATTPGRDYYPNRSAIRPRRLGGRGR
jgi:hypothetical protein